MIICIVGMTGSGKSVISDYLVERGFGFFRFGQITLDEVKKRGLEPTEENERPIREEFRKKYGMGAYAILNIPKIEELRKKGHVVGDGLYSWEEYLILKEKYGDEFKIIAVHSSPKTRYERLAVRVFDAKKDKEMRNRPNKNPWERDKAEIEKLNKGGPIAMADFHIVNEGNVEEFHKEIEKIYKKIIK